jgi:hypothetical protein
MTKVSPIAAAAIRSDFLTALAQFDQEAAHWQQLAADCDEMLSKTEVGGAWDEINARLLRMQDVARRRIEAIQEKEQVLREVLQQLSPNV